MPTSVSSRLKVFTDFFGSNGIRSRHRLSAMSSSARICAAISTARAVGCTPLPRRTTSGSAKRTLSRRNSLLIAGCVVSSAWAARVMLPSLISVSSTLRSRKSRSGDSILGM